MIRRVAILVILVLAATCAAGCDAEAAPSGGLGSLPGTTWAAASVGGKAPIAGSTPTITFDATTIKGSGGCNHIGGRYQVDATGRFAVTDFGGTAMGCVQAGVTEYETAFMQGVGLATQASFGDQGQLILRGTGPEVVLVRIVPVGGG